MIVRFKTTRKQIVLGLLFVTIASIRAANSFGAVTVNARETGEDVVFTGSGTLNLDSAMFLDGIGSTQGGVDSGVFIVAPETMRSVDDYYFDVDDFSGPSSFGPVIRTFATSGSGDAFGLRFNQMVADGFGLLLVPDGYVSGDPLTATSTYAGETIASLGLTPGAYTWSWGSDDNADSLTLNVVPEPSSVLMALVAAVMLLTKAHRFQWRDSPAFRRQLQRSKYDLARGMHKHPSMI